MTDPNEQQLAVPAEEPPVLSPSDYAQMVARRAKAASARLGALPGTVRNQALEAMADGLEADQDDILSANEKDLDAFGSGPEKAAMADRLRLTPERIRAMADGIRAVRRLPDPLGGAPQLQRRPNGMLVGKVRVPIGVIGIIYESRPNVTADSAALCLKSGNACVLRGGSEAIHSNTAIARVLSEAVHKSKVPEGAISFVERTEREVAVALLKQADAIDLIIPRGGESLMKTVAEHATIPVIKHDKGVCHMYLDADADPAMAERLVINAKAQRPSTCNALETLLVHERVARTQLPAIVKRLVEAKVEVRGCARTCQLCPEAKPAAESDYGQEFLALILAVKVVKSMDEAMEHIAAYGSRHTEAIVTNEYPAAMRFLREVDASAVLVNASTRLNDGYEFGLGAEIGISTSRLHARGPMGLEELTCTKFIVLGSGQIRE
jgi:glutamate-5-semialdehyde dehydrogenase